MKVLHLIPSLSGGGTERQLNYLAHELVEMGHDVHIAYGSKGPNEINLPGVKLHKINSGSNYNPFILLKLIFLIRKIKPDIIQTLILQMDILGGIAAKTCHIPWILKEPSSAMNYLPNWKTKLRIRIGSHASAIVSNSKGGGEYWASHLPDQRYFVIQNGIPFNQIEKIEAEVSDNLSDSHDRIVLYVGRLSADVTGNKNLKYLLEAMSVVNKKLNVITIFCGEGPQRPELEDLVKKLGIDQSVRFTGYLASAKVWALMKKASVFVSLSAYEGSPNSVMEAMVCGCPLVLSDIPAHKEIADATSAMFVNPSNIGQVANTILQVLKNDDQAQLRVEKALQRSKKWSIQEMASKYEQLFKEYAREE